MKLRASDDLLRIVAASFGIGAAASSLLLGNSPVTFMLGLILIFFLPGYALTRLFFTNRLDTDLFILCSLGISLIAAIIISLALAISPFHLTQSSSLGALLGVTLAALLADRIMHPINRKFEVEIEMPTRESTDPVVAIAIAFGIILIAIFGYILLTTSPPSTTHVALMSENLDSNLPDNTTIGSTLTFVLEIKNGEGRAADFTVETYANGSLLSDFSVYLEDLETEQFTLNATPETSGYQKIELRIYIDEVYYGEVHFWVNVLP